MLLFVCVSTPRDRLNLRPRPSLRLPTRPQRSPQMSPRNPQMSRATPPEAEPENPLTPEGCGVRGGRGGGSGGGQDRRRDRFSRLRAAAARVAKREEQEASTLLPWVITIMGWSSVLAGTVIGAGTVIACDQDSCEWPSWPSWVVIGGSLVGSLGTLWVVLEDPDIAELKIRRERIERLLEENRYDHASARAEGDTADPCLDRKLRSLIASPR